MRNNRDITLGWERDRLFGISSSVSMTVHYRRALFTALQLSWRKSFHEVSWLRTEAAVFLAIRMSSFMFNIIRL